MFSPDSARTRGGSQQFLTLPVAHGKLCLHSDFLHEAIFVFRSWQSFSLSKRFFSCHGARRSVAVFVTACIQTLFWFLSIQSTITRYFMKICHNVLFPPNLMSSIEFLAQTLWALPTNITLATWHAHLIVCILVTRYSVQLMKVYAFVSGYFTLSCLNIAPKPCS